MKYVIGVDGGGTKTTYALADESGRELRRYRNGCTNYCLSNVECVCQRLEEGVRSLLQEEIDYREIAHIHIALAGMDTPKDVQLMEKGLRETLIATMPHTIENDLWIAFFAQTDARYGAISICGTGHNTGVLLKDGRRMCIQANRYPLGNYGGGRMLCDMALNAAYMSYEHSGEKTRLEEYVAEVCQCSSLEALMHSVMDSRYSYQYNFPLPQLIERLAIEGDEVSRGILRDAGRIQAGMTGRMIAHVGMQREKLPIVLAGSIYCKGESGVLQGAFEEEIKRFCPQARLLILEREPVEGAVASALNRVWAQKLTNVGCL